MSNQTPIRDTLQRLDDAELEFIVELCLQSGSLKGLAQAYSVSYPTIRARLDRTIERLCDAMAAREPDPVQDLIAALTRRGDLTASGADSLRTALDEERTGSRQTPTDPPPVG